MVSGRSASATAHKPCQWMGSSDGAGPGPICPLKDQCCTHGLMERCPGARALASERGLIIWMPQRAPLSNSCSRQTENSVGISCIHCTGQ